MAKKIKKTRENTKDICIHCEKLHQLTERVLNAIEDEMDKDGWRPCANWRENGFEVAAFRKGKDEIYIELNVGTREKKED